jgi:hypothetical protein
MSYDLALDWKLHLLPASFVLDVKPITLDY